MFQYLPGAPSHAITRVGGAAGHETTQEYASADSTVSAYSSVSIAYYTYVALVPRVYILKIIQSSCGFLSMRFISQNYLDCISTHVYASFSPPVGWTDPVHLPVFRCKVSLHGGSDLLVSCSALHQMYIHILMCTCNVMVLYMNWQWEASVSKSCSSQYSNQSALDLLWVHIICYIFSGFHLPV